MLEARSLTKYFNHTLAVKDVSFPDPARGDPRIPRAQRRGQEHDGQDAHRTHRALRRPDLLQRPDRLRRFHGLSAAHRLRPRGAASVPPPHRARVPATRRPPARHRAHSARKQNGRVPAALQPLGRPALAARVVFERHAAEDPALRGAAARSRSADPGRAVLRPRRDFGAGAAAPAARAGGRRAR